MSALPHAAAPTPWWREPFVGWPGPALVSPGWYVVACHCPACRTVTFWPTQDEAVACVWAAHAVNAHQGEAAWAGDEFRGAHLRATVEVLSSSARLWQASVWHDGWRWRLPLDRYPGKLHETPTGRRVPRAGEEALWRRLTPAALGRIGDRGVLP